MRSNGNSEIIMIATTIYDIVKIVFLRSCEHRFAGKKCAI